MYDIVYKPRTTIKAQALSDFVAEWTEIQTPPKERELEFWTINFNGSLQLQGAGAGILVTSSKGECFKYVLQMYFLASNKAVEYEALLHGLRITTALSIHWLKVLRDSLLIVNQANCCHMNWIGAGNSCSKQEKPNYPVWQTGWSGFVDSDDS
jgi:ribonuclease HI